MPVVPPAGTVDFTLTIEEDKGSEADLPIKVK
jgi:hypothetical protein